MPEGPEIRRAADRVAKAVAGRELAVVTFAFQHLRAFEGQLTDAEVDRVDTHGKAMLTRFSCGLTVYSHNQLYGRWITTKSAAEPDTRRSLRFAIIAYESAARLYSASEIDVIPTADVHSDPRIAKLGPDALHPDVTASLLQSRLRSKTFAGRQLAALLLDQGFVAGLGNYLRSDILHRCKLHPKRRPKDLNDDEVSELATTILSLTRQAYRTQGVTNDPDRVRELKAAGKKRRDYRHLAYGRARRQCYECDGRITRADFAGRAVYLCPRCQPEP